MPLAASAPLLFVHLLAACVWVGGMVAIAVVTRVARRELAVVEQVALFRAVGRSYGIVGTTALALALGTGAALLADRGWDAQATVAAALAAALVVVTAAGIRQARGMTRLREAAARHPDDAALAAVVRRGARRAGALRSAIAALTIALLAFGSTLA